MKRQLTKVTLICGLLWSSEGVVVMADERTAPPLLPPQERQNSAQVAKNSLPIVFSLTLTHQPIM